MNKASRSCSCLLVSSNNWMIICFFGFIKFRATGNFFHRSEHTRQMFSPLGELELIVRNISHFVKAKDLSVCFFFSTDYFHPNLWIFTLGNISSEYFSLRTEHSTCVESLKAHIFTNNSLVRYFPLNFLFTPDNLFCQNNFHYEQGSTKFNSIKDVYHYYAVAV